MFSIRVIVAVELREADDGRQRREAIGVGQRLETKRDVGDGCGAGTAPGRVVEATDGGDYTKVSFTYAIYERMQYDAGEGCCRRQRSP